ncbi:MAG: hypothetical protein IH591_13700 [Bacteroidales bacterium]|nr:hypothetical protein [Bacteroidales bacterium]
MKRTVILFSAALIALAGCNTVNKYGNMVPGDEFAIVDSTDATNNFYDNVETYSLPMSQVIVDGEIENPGPVDFSGLPLRSVIVKEALPDGEGGNRFTGAFRYDGYSLLDILNAMVLKKANAGEFEPIIDLYVEVESSTGEKAVFSWGEIYYPNNLHRIMIATRVARIVPSKTNELWDLPTESRVVAGNDLLTARNISDPVRVTVRSYPKSFETVKGMSPMYSESFSVYGKDEELLAEVKNTPAGLIVQNFQTIFYGRGRGIHSTTPFHGVMVKELLSGYYPFSSTAIRTGLLCVVAADGYRMSVSWSELFNRNDQQEMLLIEDADGEDGGRFRFFPACDFFSDRAIKSVKCIYYME